MKSEPVHNRLIVLILLCYPALLLTVKGGMGVLFFLLLILSLFSLYRMRSSHPVSHWDGYSIAFALAMASPVLAIFLSQAYHGQFSARPYDWAARFLLSIPIFLALRQTHLRAVMFLQLGIPLGALITVITLYFHHNDWNDGRYTTEIAFNLIHFGDAALMLGLLSLFSINWEQRDHPSILILKFGGFLAGVYMSIQTGERGGWIAIPPLLLLWSISYSRERIWLKLSIATLAIGCAAVMSYLLVDVIHSRIDSIFTDLNNFAQGIKDTSFGVRVQQWQTAGHLFLENPVFGVGPGGFLQAMPALSQQGMLSAEAARMGNAEIHSEIFAKASETGIFGLMSLLSIYIVPTAIFWKAARSAVPLVRRACFMGICLVAGFFIFGLTVEIFNLKMTAAFFSLTLAVLMAAATTKTAH
ncbi:MAG: O-antigen ligase family protein [Nitrosomonadales bacterium]|nr:O-antigen ligase family protein [Nitrosomonadales bacterium]